MRNSFLVSTVFVICSMSAFGQQDLIKAGDEKLPALGAIRPAATPDSVVNDQHARHDLAIAEMARGRELLRAGDREGSIAHLKNALVLDPQLHSAKADLGVIYLKTKKFDLAATMLGDAIENGEKSAANWQYLGYIYDQMKETNKAINAYTNAIEADPEIAIANNNLGFDYIARNDYPRAEAAFKEALRIDPHMRQPVGGLCVTSWMMDRPADAAGYCVKARDPMKPTAFVDYVAGWALYSLGRYPEAQDSLQEATRLSPASPQMLVALGAVQTKLHNPTDALRNYQRALDLDPNHAPAYAGIGVTLYGEKKYRDAQQAFDKALLIDPELVDAHYNLAVTCLTMGKRECAIEQYSILKSIEPGLSANLFSAIYGSKLLNLNPIARR